MWKYITDLLTPAVSTVAHLTHATECIAITLDATVAKSAFDAQVELDAFADEQFRSEMKAHKLNEIRHQYGLA